MNELKVIDLSEEFEEVDFEDCQKSGFLGLKSCCNVKQE